MARRPLLLASLVLASCLEPEEEITPAGCTYDTVVYKEGATFPSTDGCNTCTCTSGGSVICTLMACPQECTWGGKTYATDDTWAADACGNTCTCHADGSVACTDLACGGCTEDGKTYAIGESFAKACNTCTCGSGGVVTCTEAACTCEHGGKTYEIGQSFDSGDGCNTCTCGDDGVVACTDEACPVTCTEGGKTYQVGDSFPAADGCNTCSCTENGIICTKMACPVTCAYGGKTYQVGESFPATDGCNTCSCLGEGGVSCTEKACVTCQVEATAYPVGATWTDGCLTCTCAEYGEPTCQEKDCPTLCFDAAECTAGQSCIEPPCYLCGMQPPGYCVPPAAPPDLCWLAWDCGETSLCVGAHPWTGKGGQCLPNLPLGSCWDQAQCPEGAWCEGAVYCPSDLECDADPKPGACKLAGGAEGVVLWLEHSYYMTGSTIAPVWWNLTSQTIYLGGCATYTLEEGVEGAWKDLGPPVQCAWEGIAVAVPPGGAHATQEMQLPQDGASSFGTYRIRGEYGLGCQPQQALSQANCKEMAETTWEFSAGPPPP